MLCAIGWVPQLLIKVSQGTAPSIDVYRTTNSEIHILGWRECPIIFCYFLYLLNSSTLPQAQKSSFIERP